MRNGLTGLTLAGALVLPCGCAGTAIKHPRCDGVDTTAELSAMTGLAWLPAGFVEGVRASGGVAGHSAADFVSDGDELTFWQSTAGPVDAELVLGLDTVRLVKELRYRLTADGAGGRVEVYVSGDARCWGDPVATGALREGGGSIGLRAKAGKYIRLMLARDKGKAGPVAIAEVEVGVGAGFASEAPRYVLEGDPYRYQPQIDLVANEPPVYELIAGPKGAQVEPQTGLVSWTPAFGQAGAHTIHLRARANQGQAEQSFEVDVLKADVMGTGEVTAEDGGRLVVAGTGTFFDGAEVEFAPGALPRDETIRLLRVTGNTPPLWREHAPVGDWFAVRPVFDEPVNVKVTLKIAPAHLPPWASLEHVGLVRFGEGLAVGAEPGPQVPFPAGETRLIPGDQQVGMDMQIMGIENFTAVASYWARQQAGGFDVWWACEPPTVCGNGACDVGEDCGNCPGDCGTCGSCGDGVCSASECQSCANDCGGALDAGTCVIAPSCGDGFCNGTEDCSRCPGDCGTCTCGDGACTAGECTACPADCPDCNPEIDACEAVKPRVDELLGLLEEVEGLYQGLDCRTPPLTRVYVGSFFPESLSHGYQGKAFRRQINLPTQAVQLPHARSLIAHEYFHAIQSFLLSYNWAYTWPIEATAVFMEDVVYDDANWFVQFRAPWDVLRTLLPMGGPGHAGYRKMMLFKHLATVGTFDACAFYNQFAPRLRASTAANAAEVEHRATLDALAEYLDGVGQDLAERWLTFASEYNIFRRDTQIDEISKLLFTFSTTPANFVVCEQTDKVLKSVVAGAQSWGVTFVPRPGASHGVPGARIAVESKASTPTAVPKYRIGLYDGKGTVIRQETAPVSGEPVVLDLPRVAFHQPYFITYANTDYHDQLAHDVTITVSIGAITTISGVVTDSTGAAVKAKVTATPSQGETCNSQASVSVNSDGRGTYELRLALEKAGPVELLAECPSGQGNASTAVMVAPGDSASHDLQIPADCSFVCTSLGAGYVACPNSGDCAHESWFCDGTPDCPQGEDELTCSDGATACGGGCP
jgi:hypothetical protein